MPFILSIDEGTSSARAVLYDEEAKPLAMESVPIPSQYPKPGWVEQDAAEIWRAQLWATRTLLQRTGVSASGIMAAGITNQRETTVVWDRQTGEPVSPAIVWQCRRTADFCAALAESPEASEIERVTGLVSTPTFPRARSVGFWIVFPMAKLARGMAICFSVPLTPG